MKIFRSYSILLILFALVNQLNAQNKVGIFISIPEGPGVFYNHDFAGNLSASLKASGTPWFTRTNDNWNGGESIIKTNLFYTGIFLKKYISGTKEHQGMYLGGYARYFINHWWRQDFEMLNSGQQMAVEEIYKQGSKTTLSETTHKISAGALAGYRKDLNKILYIDFTLGLGFAPPPLYWTNNRYYFHAPDSEKVGPDWITGYLNHVGLFGYIGLHLDLIKFIRE